MNIYRVETKPIHILKEESEFLDLNRYYIGTFWDFVFAETRGKARATFILEHSNSWHEIEWLSIASVRLVAKDIPPEYIGEWNYAHEQFYGTSFYDGMPGFTDYLYTTG